VLVTADHGRSASFRDHGGGYPESGRVWLVARAPRLPARGLLDLTTHLSSVAPTIRCLLGLRTDDSASAGASIAPLCQSD
jgi:arylsulfatase A-like enzyme